MTSGPIENEGTRWTFDGHILRGLATAQERRTLFERQMQGREPADAAQSLPPLILNRPCEDWILAEVLPDAWFTHPGANLRPDERLRTILLEGDGTGYRSCHPTIERIIGSSMAGCAGRADADTISRLLADPPGDDDALGILYWFLQGIGDKQPDDTDLWRLQVEERLTIRELARAFRVTGVHTGRLVHRINVHGLAPHGHDARAAF